MFKKTFIYIKIHNYTGLKYFGRTIRKNVYKYKGSGKYWKRHIKIHGYDCKTFVIKIFDNEKKTKKSNKEGGISLMTRYHFSNCNNNF